MDWLTPQNTPLRTDCECIRRTLSESRVRENRMHGLMRGAGINPCLYSTVLFSYESLTDSRPFRAYFRGDATVRWVATHRLPMVAPSGLPSRSSIQLIPSSAFYSSFRSSRSSHLRSIGSYTTSESSAAHS